MTGRIEGITDEKHSLFKENKLGSMRALGDCCDTAVGAWLRSLDKKGIMEGKRAREAEAEEPHAMP